jgi:hypothetical protein
MYYKIEGVLGYTSCTWEKNATKLYPDEALAYLACLVLTYEQCSIWSIKVMTLCTFDGAENYWRW